ncbi:phosphatase PAP2 family protein [Actinophytocola glycyrrhizae]|uniref:Phosphatase PAP2 family protein n=1 Tax=Actinophytocola glycyrrhizae TaxID=2044873 RepID=A0ABV9S8K0_9PSEU
MRVRQQGITAAACVLFALVLGLVHAGERVPSDLDDAAWSAVDGWPHGVLRALVLPTEPYVLLPVLAAVALWCLRAARPGDALFVVLGPAVAVAVNTWVLKPLFDRWKGDTLVYPSGHTVSMVATLVVVAVLVDGRARVVTAVVGVVLLACAAAGMVGLGYHYVTDVVGGAFFAVFAVLAVRGLVRSRRTRPDRGR